MDASQYKDYVLSLLFIKYISGKYAGMSPRRSPIKIPKGASFTDMVALKGMDAEIVAAEAKIDKARQIKAWHDAGTAHRKDEVGLT